MTYFSDISLNNEMLAYCASKVVFFRVCKQTFDQKTKTRTRLLCSPAFVLDDNDACL